MKTMLPDVKSRIQDIIGDQLKAEAVMTVIREEELREKEVRSQRQTDGIEAAKQRGVQFGRPLMEFPKNFSKIYKKQREGALTITEASRALNISRQQFYRLRKRFEDDQGL